LKDEFEEWGPNKKITVFRITTVASVALFLLAEFVSVLMLWGKQWGL